MSKLNKLKKPLLILGIIAGALVLMAVLLGIFNGLSEKPLWNLGWSDYRYDDSAYTVGDGTVFAEGITSVSLDWIDGKVKVVLCDDDYISLTETSVLELTEESRVHWFISEEGNALSVKYRASSWFLGKSQNKHKVLTVRIPRHMMENLERLEIHTISSDIEIVDVNAKMFTIQTTSGDMDLRGCNGDRLLVNAGSGALTFEGGVQEELRVEGKTGEIKITSAVTPKTLDLQITAADMTVTLPQDASFALTYESRGNQKPDLDFPTRTENDRYLCGNDSAHADFTVKTKTGKLKITY